MRSHIVVCIALSLLFCACKGVAPHLAPARIAPILADLHAADAYSSIVRDSLHKNAEKNYDSLTIWTAQIFSRHNTTMQEFNSSMDWYRDHPVALDSLYASVIPILEKEKK